VGHALPIQVRAAAELERRRREAESGTAGGTTEAEEVLSFRQFIRRVNPRYKFYRHSEALIEVLQRVADDELKRVMVFMPPRHGKSELVSRLFSAYYLYRHPERFVGINSYAAELAYTFSRAARENYTRAGGELSDEASAVKQWETTTTIDVEVEDEDGTSSTEEQEVHGGLWAAGVGGPITGKGFHLGIIDDPLKNAEEAQSEAIRKKQKDWYDSTFYTREEPGGAVIIVQTRWNADDLSGWLLAREKEDPEEAERWHLVNFEAVRSESGPGSARTQEFPETCTIEPDWREAGEALCPERYTAKKLLKIKGRIGSYFWSALYMQSPSSDEGDLWQRVWIKVYDVLPEDVHSLGYDWDTAYTEAEKNAANAYVKSASDDVGNVYIDDVDWRWCETPELVKWMRVLGGPHFIEAKASGKSAKQFLDRESIYAVEVPVNGGDKIARTRNVLPVAEAGKLWVRRAVLQKLLDDDKQGILKFPNGTHADVNDVVVQAINRHTGGLNWLMS
jgi:hypothetical protein